MNAETLPRTVRFAFPFAILARPDTVRLIAGEELRYTLRSPSLDEWLPQFLRSFQEEIEWRSLLNQLPSELHEPALQIITRLYSERVLLEGNGESEPISSPVRCVVEGSGNLSERLRAAVPAVSGSAAHVAVLGQESLDYATALDFNRRARRSSAAGWLWVSCGAMGRGFVSALFRPQSGPCLECLIRNFQRLSDTPAIYEHLIEHSRSGGQMPQACFPAAAIDFLAALARWKIERSAETEPPSGVYRLHVVEVDTMECTTHRVFRDLHCPECATT